jgi:hypothetical protein
VGVFPGGFSGRRIATLNGGFAEASQAGGTLRFSLAREKGSPQAAATRQYRVVLANGANICEIGISLGDSPKPWFGGLCTGNPGYPRSRTSPRRCTADTALICYRQL